MLQLLDEVVIKVWNYDFGLIHQQDSWHAALCCGSWRSKKLYLILIQNIMWNLVFCLIYYYWLFIEWVKQILGFNSIVWYVPVCLSVSVMSHNNLWMHQLIFVKRILHVLYFYLTDLSLLFLRLTCLKMGGENVRGFKFWKKKTTQKFTLASK